MLHAELLAQIPLFEGLSDGDREGLAQRLTERSYERGKVVFAKGDRGSSMFIVLSGQVQIFLPAESADAPRIVLKDYGFGEYFGELALFDDKPRSASVEAIEDAVLLELTREHLGEHLMKSKNAAIAILSDMAARLRETNELLGQRAAKDVVKEIEENLTWGERLADKVADLNGSWAFILFLMFLTIGWAVFNSPSLPGRPFDEYPFQFYNLFLAILVALQGPLIVMSQNRQTLKDRKQAETDYRVNLKNELGIERLIRELSVFRSETAKRLEYLERLARSERIRAELPNKNAPNPPGGSWVADPSDARSKVPSPEGTRDG
ncbi:DUF1003 domain-containing protein [Pendulispora albinea]|uniref:DUF1003 domain-containing protein n=1 Tax=Pendulispora albinea TaxID=2741071 RepID=A0ABZ2M5F9_9BACT